MPGILLKDHPISEMQDYGITEELLKFVISRPKSFGRSAIYLMDLHARVVEHGYAPAVHDSLKSAMTAGEHMTLDMVLGAYTPMPNGFPPDVINPLSRMIKVSMGRWLSPGASAQEISQFVSSAVHAGYESVPALRRIDTIGDRIYETRPGDLIERIQSASSADPGAVAQTLMPARRHGNEQIRISVPSDKLDDYMMLKHHEYATQFPQAAPSR